MTSEPNLQRHDLDAAASEATKRGKAVTDATAMGVDRRSDEEAFGAFVLAVKTAISTQIRGRSNADVIFTFSDGRGVLTNAGTNRVIFYLNDGYLISKVPPAPAPLIVPYVRRKSGQVLSWYEFALQQKTFNELQMAEQLLAIAN
jgi:hypothetical protein